LTLGPPLSKVAQNLKFLLHHRRTGSGPVRIIQRRIFLAKKCPSEELSGEESSGRSMLRQRIFRFRGAKNSPAKNHPSEELPGEESSASGECFFRAKNHPAKNIRRRIFRPRMFREPHSSYTLVCVGVFSHANPIFLWESWKQRKINGSLENSKWTILFSNCLF
jgi:hypothetical protein